MSDTTSGAATRRARRLAPGVLLGLGALMLLSSVAAQQRTLLPPCSAGRTRTADGLGCCWPGQTWARGACAGAPRCPAGAVVVGDECTVRCPEGMLPVSGGTFAMGSRGGDADERPVREVTVTSFCIDATEVTAGAYRACVDASACSPPQSDDVGHTFRPGPPGCPDRSRSPINGVSWEDARTYCASQGRRLPTEAEWEYAARGTDDRTFPWGDQRPLPQASELGASSECPNPPCFETCILPVGSFPRAASPFGAQDMAGSVWEWVADWYGPYDPSRTHDPTGAASGAQRVLRGGAASRVEDRRAANRSHGPPTSRSLAVGFRCARSAEPGER